MSFHATKNTSGYTVSHVKSFFILSLARNAPNSRSYCLFKFKNAFE